MSISQNIHLLNKCKSACFVSHKLYFLKHSLFKHGIDCLLKTTELDMFQTTILKFYLTDYTLYSALKSSEGIKPLKSFSQFSTFLNYLPVDELDWLSLFLFLWSEAITSSMCYCLVEVKSLARYYLIFFRRFWWGQPKLTSSYVYHNKLKKFLFLALKKTYMIPCTT